MISAPLFDLYQAGAYLVLGALALDVGWRLRDYWRRRGVLCVGSDRALDVQCVSSRGGV